MAAPSGGRTASGFGLNDTLFDMWATRRRAQFAQRFVLFKPRSAVRFAIAGQRGRTGSFSTSTSADHDQKLMAPAAERFLLDADGALPRS